MKRKISALTALLLVVLLIAACASPAAPAQPDGATDQPAAADQPAEEPAQAEEDAAAVDGAAPVTIRAAWWGDTRRNEVYQEIIDRFMEEYPHVTVLSEPAAWGDYWERLTVQAAGGNAPDFFGMNFSFAADYIRRGVLAPLDQFVADGVINLDGWTQGTINTGIVDGTNYMIAMGVTNAGTFLNVGLFEELGVALPAYDWSWNDFRELGLQVREASDARGGPSLYIGGNRCGDLGGFRFFSIQRGTDTFDPDGNMTINVADVEEWFAMWQEFTELGIVPDPDTSAEFAGATLEDSMFGRGRVLSANTAANQFPLFSNTFPDKSLALVRNPNLENAPIGKIIEGSHWAVSASAPPENQLAAAQLLNFWVNHERSLEIFLLDQGVPGNLPQVQNVIIPLLEGAQQVFADYVDSLAGLAVAPSMPPLGIGELNSVFTEMSEMVRFGVLSPADAAQQFMDEANDILARHAN